MESSSAKNEFLYDPIRKKRVGKTKEELIRQRLVQHMIHDLGYPAALIAVEKELSQLPHLKLTPIHQIPKRRADIIVFAKDPGNVDLKPLMMIECKAVPLLPKFANQVIGYNAFVRAPFIALANEEQIMTGCFDKTAGVFRFQKGLLSFSQAIEVSQLP